MKTKPPPTPRGSWMAVRTACRDDDDKKRLQEVIAAGVTPLEFSELTRARFRRPNRDFPTPFAYRQSLRYFKSNASQEWLRLFRENGGQPLPPRDARALVWPPGPFGIDQESPLWSWHSPHFLALIDSRTREYFQMTAHEELHPNAWSAGWRAYHREIDAKERESARALRKESRTLKALTAMLNDCAQSSHP